MLRHEVWGWGGGGVGRFPPPQQPNRPTAVCLTGLPSTFPCRKSLNTILSKETFWNLEGLTVILPFFCSPMKLQWDFQEDLSAVLPQLFLPTYATSKRYSGRPVYYSILPQFFLPTYEKIPYAKCHSSVGQAFIHLSQSKKSFWMLAFLGL